MPLTFNLFAPLRFSPALAAKVLHALLPGLGISAVQGMHFEHAPRHRHGAPWPDQTGLDCAATYTTSDGRRGFLGFEAKYSECMTGAHASGLHPNYNDLARASGLFLEPDARALRRAPIEQLFREHLLIQSAVAEGQWDQACLVLVAPRDNDHVQRAATAYARQLRDPASGIPFINLHLEDVITAIAAAGEPEYAQALHRRYTDWSPVTALIEHELAEQQSSWGAPLLTSAPQPHALLGAA